MRRFSSRFSRGYKKPSFRRSRKTNFKIMGFSGTTLLIFGVAAYLFTPFKDVINGMFKKK